MERSLQKLPSASEIAKEAGVTKGVIYHYFRSREEIYLTLMSQLSAGLFELLHAAVADSNYSPTKCRDGFVGYCAKNDVLMFLGLAAPAVLEAKVSVEFAKVFKREAAEGIVGLADAWAQREPRLSVAELRDFILRLYYASLTEWQHSRPPQVVLQAFPELDNWMLQGNFSDALTTSFDWLWAGMHANHDGRSLNPSGSGSARLGG